MILCDRSIPFLNINKLETQLANNVPPKPHLFLFKEKYSEQLCWLESTHYIIEPVDPSQSFDNIGAMGFYNVPIYKTTGGKSGYVGLYNKGQRIAVSYYQVCT